MARLDLSDVYRDLRRSACVGNVIDWAKAVFAEQ